MKTTPKTQKLTTSQNAALCYLSQNPSADFYDLCRAGVGGGATTKKLEALNLITVSEDGGMKCWTITELGAQAYSTGRYSATNVKGDSRRLGAEIDQTASSPST